jgi:hypothetical protein
MSWIGGESADDGRQRGRGTGNSGNSPARGDWLLRVRLGRRVIEVRLIDTTETEAHTCARRLSGEYTLRPAP